ncbi:hypothetical protein V8G53_10635 [Bacillus velezensis]|nr:MULTISPECIES: hypothetical protein [Bacillus amyloliquefaciens group]
MSAEGLHEAGREKAQENTQERSNRFWHQMMNTNMQSLKRGKGGAFKRK